MLKILNVHNYACIVSHLIQQTEGVTKLYSIVHRIILQNYIYIGLVRIRRRAIASAYGTIYLRDSSTMTVCTITWTQQRQMNTFRQSPSWFRRFRNNVAAAMYLSWSTDIGCKL